MRANAGFRFLALVVAIAGCNSTGVPSPSPGAVLQTARPSATTTLPPPETHSPVPTHEPTAPTDPTHEPDPAVTENPAISLWAQDPPTPLLMNSAVRIVVDELNLRARPDTSARRVATLSAGTILDLGPLPPVEADGYIWYHGYVRPPDLDDDPVSGYLAAWKGSTPYVTLLAARCPAVVDHANVAAMLPAERLACFGDRTIELEGTFGCRNCLSHIFGDYEPSWLLNPNDLNLLWDVPMVGSSLNLRFPPGGLVSPEVEGFLRVRGHFRDAASSACSMAMDYWWDDGIDSHAVPDVVARVLCWQEFVVESYEVRGVDARWDAI